MSRDTHPECPECGGPIGQTANYCMHCSADLTGRRPSEEAVPSGTDVGAAAGGSTAGTASNAEPTGNDGQLLDPDGLIDNTLTALVGIAGGVMVGVVAAVVLFVVTESGWSLGAGVLAWLGATAHLARRRTVQGAVSRTGYAVAAVLLLVPAVAVSPAVTVDGGDRGGLFLVLLVFAAVPAAIAAGVGWLASRFVPEPVDAEG